MKIVILLTYLLSSYMLSEMILVSNKDINYKEIVDEKNLRYIQSDQKIRCRVFDKNLFRVKSYEARHYIKKNRAICYKDLKMVKVNKVRYDFGNIVIQRDGKILGETNEYIKVKSNNGKIYKIKKNGF